MSHTLLNKVRAWVGAPLSEEVARSVERIGSLEDVQTLALMPDVHLAEGVCVGAVVASRERVYPDAVGSDIGCGMACLRLRGGPARVTEPEAARILERLRHRVPSNRQVHRQSLFIEGADLVLSSPALQRVIERDGRVQLGTLGRGNHFVELQIDDEDSYWLMVHTGSRALGPAIRKHHASRTGSSCPGASCPRGSSPLHGLLADASEGLEYLRDHDVAVAYASLNRDVILTAASRVVAEVLGAEADKSTRVECVHNFVRREEHGGATLWVHRKGAISARLDEPGIIPGSMGTESFLVAGRGEPASLCSSSHGAGRAMSRGEARARVSLKRLDREMAEVWFDGAMAHALREEAPSAYKPISEVMEAQRDLTRITRRLRPVLAYKGG